MDLFCGNDTAQTTTTTAFQSTEVLKVRIFPLHLFNFAVWLDIKCAQCKVIFGFTDYLKSQVREMLVRMHLSIKTFQYETYFIVMKYIYVEY